MFKQPSWYSRLLPLGCGCVISRPKAFLKIPVQGLVKLGRFLEIIPPEPAHPRINDFCVVLKDINGANLKNLYRNHQLSSGDTLIIFNKKVLIMIVKIGSICLVIGCIFITVRYIAKNRSQQKNTLSDQLKEAQEEIKRLKTY